MLGIRLAQLGEYGRCGGNLEALLKSSSSFSPIIQMSSRILRFYAALGGAISGWQLVETALYEVYERAIVPQQPGAAAAGFHAIQTFNGKLAVTDAAIRFRLWALPDVLESWIHLKRRADKRSQRRNQLVHFSTWIMFNEENENDKIRLEPQMYDYRFQSDKPRFRISEVTDIASTFGKLARNCGSFHEN